MSHQKLYIYLKKTQQYTEHDGFKNPVFVFNRNGFSQPLIYLTEENDKGYKQIIWQLYKKRGVVKGLLFYSNNFH